MSDQTTNSTRCPQFNITSQARDILLASQARNNPAFIALNEFFLYFSVIFTILSVILWVGLKDRYERTRIRPTGLTIIPALGTLVNILVAHLGYEIQRSIPCALMIFLLVHSVALIAGSILARIVYFDFVSTFARNAAVATSAIGSSDGESSTGFVDPILGLYDHFLNFRQATIIILRIFALQRPFKPTEGKQEDTEANLRSLRLMKSAFGVNLVVGAYLVPFNFVALVLILSYLPDIECNNCTNVQQTTLYILIVSAVWSVMLGVFAYIRVRPLRDPWGLRSEAFWLLACAAGAVVFFFLDLFDDTFRKGDGSIYQHYYMLTIFILLFLWFSIVWQLILGWKEQRDRSLSDSLRRPSRLSSTSTPLDQILADKISSTAFEKHLVEELGVESLLFVRDAEKWKSEYFDVTPTSRRSRAKKIYMTYIVTTGLLAINIPDGMVRAIASELDDSHSDVPVHLFDAALKEIRSLLAVGAVPRFLKSKLYRSGTSQVLAQHEF